MSLTTIESDFLSRLSLESWTSPPVFDHSLLERMVFRKYVTTRATGHGVHYEITNSGRAEILKANLAYQHCQVGEENPQVGRTMLR